jgi:hypothetical protein
MPPGLPFAVMPGDVHHLDSIEKLRAVIGELVPGSS